MEFLVLSLLGLAGILLHILAKFRDLVTKTPKDGLSFKQRLIIVWAKFDVLGNLAYGLFALIAVLVLVGIRDKIDALLPITWVSIIFIGYAADSAVKNLQNKSVN